MRTKKRKPDFYSPLTDPDGSYTGTRRAIYGQKSILPGIPPSDVPLTEEVPVQDADDL